VQLIGLTAIFGLGRAAFRGPALMLSQTAVFITVPGA
jgi:hypothetical protein